MTADIPTLRLHSRNTPIIEKLVQRLALWGYRVDCRIAYNRFNKSIEAAVKRFQAQHLDVDGRPLVVDGVVGDLTWGALLRPADDEQRLGLGKHKDSLDFSVQRQAQEAYSRALTTTGMVAVGVADTRIPVKGPTNTGNAQWDVYRFLRNALADYDADRRETPLGSNICPWLEPRAQGKPWCSYQVHAWIKSVLGKWIFGGRRGSCKMDLRCTTVMGARSMIVTSPRPGDVFLLCDAEGVPYHTGLVLRYDSEYGPMTGQYTYTMQTIEGNCANRVAMREREITYQVVFWRPFPGELDWTPGLLPSVKRVQARREGTR